MNKTDEPIVHCAHTRMVPIDKLKPNPKNPNTHPENQIRLLAKIIRVQGWRVPITVSKRSGFIVRGHGRLAAARLAGCTVCPVDDQNYPDAATETADLIADNQIAELAEMDGAALQALLRELEEADFDMDITGFDTENLKEMMQLEFMDGDMSGVARDGETANDAEAAIDRAAEMNRKWKVKRGDLFVIGSHRLLCGDSTAKDDVERLLAGAVPFICVTDPPYGVSYDPAWRAKAAREGHLTYGARRCGKVDNDDQADWREAWALFPGDVIYTWHPAGATSLVHAEALQASGFKIRMQIIWAKSNFPISRGDYHVKHEPCWYAVREGKVAKRTDDRTQTTLWLINLDKNVEGGHSTQKPLECMARPIRNHIVTEIYDPFLGSGTTMVACENLHRRCWGMEINPDYCAVILDRMSHAFSSIEIQRAEAAKARKKK